MVGALAAQSITPVPLYSKFLSDLRSGCSRLPNNIGMLHLKELLYATPASHKSITKIYLAPPTNFDSVLARKVDTSMQHRTLLHLLHSYEIYYEPNFSTTNIQEDTDLVRCYIEIPDEDINTDAFLPWLVRMEVRHEMINKLCVHMAFLAMRINEVGWYSGMFNIIFEDNNAEKLILRLRIARDAQKYYGVPQWFCAHDDAGLRITKWILEEIL
jgi:hypothetical protein